MKLTTIFLFVACLHVSAKGLTQTVSLSEKDAPLQKVIKAIEAQTDYAFFYKTSWLQQAKRITIKAENIPLKEALDLCFKGQPLSYVISGKNITIEPKDEVPVEKPTIDISGKITDKDGNALAGANIKIKGTNKGTIANADGSFILKGVDDNAVLEISYVGFETTIVSLQGRRSLVINLNPKSNSLDEMQVIAYGTTTRRFSTGNVTSVKAEDIRKQPVSNPLLALQGRVPGLFITQNNGLPGGGVTVRIQGQNSLLNGNDPLYVVDGVPYIQQLRTTGVSSDILGNSGGQVNGANFGVGNPLTYINPNDIESIEVLKDADATAIYGSRAANGAILITMKKGNQGQRKIDVNMQTGWGKVASKIKMLNSREYLDMRYEAFQNDGINWQAPSFSANDLKIYDTTRYTDWQKELIGGTARYTNLNTSISGGSDAFQYLVGTTYYKETTVFPVDYNDRKGGLYFNLNSGQPKQKLHFQLSVNYLFDDNQLPITDVTQNAVLLEPISPNLYNPDGTLNWQPNTNGTSTFINPIADKLTNSYRNKTNNIIGNAVLSYRILPGLDFRSSVGYTYMQTVEFAAAPVESTRPEDRPSTNRFAQYGFRNINSWIIEPQLNFNRNLLSGNLQILIGATINQTQQNGYSISGSGYRTDAAMNDIRSAVSITPRASFNSVYKYNAGFARLNYNWRDKIILNLNARRDGSSRFGPESQFHNFGSIGAAWIFTQEIFFNRNLKFLSFGKIRGNYGTTGSDQIGDYTFMNLFNPTLWGVAYQGTTGSAPIGHNNPYLEWEETKKLSIGLDLGFIQDKVVVSANYQRNSSSNQLLGSPLPVYTGFSGVTANLPATIENTSWEFSANLTNVKTKDLTWSTNFNITIPKNKLVDFPNLSTSGYASSYVVGQPIRIVKVFHFLGVDPARGVQLVADSNGHATDNPSFSKDKTVIINTNPKFYGGLQNSLSYKGFQLDFLLQFVKQLGINCKFNNGNREPGQFFRGFSNQPVTVLNRWRKPGDETDIQKFSTSLFGLATNSDAVYSDASYIRLKNVSFSYNIPEKIVKRIKLSNCRVYAQSQNLLTITDYQGLDPENQTVNSLPPLRVITIGMQIVL